ncbi:MAG: NAD-binding protein [Paracoccaceae bacterium]
MADGEALMLAKRGGLDLKTAWQAIAASSGSSFVHETEGQLILNGSYDIAFTMDLALKDLGFAMGFGREFGVPLDLASLTNQTFMKGKAVYGGAAQSTQIVKLLEDALGTDLRGGRLSGPAGVTLFICSQISPGGSRRAGSPPGSKPGDDAGVASAPVSGDRREGDPPHDFIRNDDDRRFANCCTTGRRAWGREIR